MMVNLLHSSTTDDFLHIFYKYTLKRGECNGSFLDQNGCQINFPQLLWYHQIHDGERKIVVS